MLEMTLSENLTTRRNYIGICEIAIIARTNDSQQIESQV